MIFRHFFLNGELFDGCICLCSFLFKALWHVLASARQESKQFAQSELWLYVTKSKRPTGHLSTSECVYILKPLNHSMNKASKRSSKPIYQMQQLHTPRCFCSSFLETSAPPLWPCVSWNVWTSCCMSSDWWPGGWWGMIYIQNRQHSGHSAPAWSGKFHPGNHIPIVWL